MKKRIGLLGGTFDPLHFGHLQLAEIAMSQCCLDRILFIPAANPPHKTDRRIAGFQHRVNMLRLVLAHRPVLQLTTLEGDLPSPSYTIDTLACLAQKCPHGGEFYFILGVDAFLEIDTWKSYRELLMRTNFIVAGRSGCSFDAFEALALSLGYVPKDGIWLYPSADMEMHYLSEATDDISSSAVREAIRRGLSLHGLVPEEVIDYIEENNLYEGLD